MMKDERRDKKQKLRVVTSSCDTVPVVGQRSSLKTGNAKSRSKTEDRNGIPRMLPSEKSDD